MPRSLQSLGEESLQATVATRWQRQCENFFAPFFFDAWEPSDVKDDDETLATIEEYSFADEGPVNVRVAVQVRLCRMSETAFDACALTELFSFPSPGYGSWH